MNGFGTQPLGRARLPTKIGDTCMSPTIPTRRCDAETRIAATKTKALTAVNDIAAETARAVIAKLVGQDVSLDDVKKVLQPTAGK